MAEIPVTIEHSLKDYLYELTQHYTANGHNFNFFGTQINADKR
jgi:hypothetical protein